MLRTSPGLETEKYGGAGSILHVPQHDAHKQALLFYTATLMTILGRGLGDFMYILSKYTI